MDWDDELQAFEEECYLARLNALADLELDKKIPEHIDHITGLISKLDVMIANIYPGDPNLFNYSHRSIQLSVTGFHLYRLREYVLSCYKYS